MKTFALGCFQLKVRVCPKISGDQRGLIFRKNTRISGFAGYIQALFIHISDVTLTVFKSLEHQEESHEQDKN